MLRLLIDESFNNHVIDAVRRLGTGLDVIDVADIGLLETDDRIILQRAAELERVVVTSDVQTMVGFAYDRIDAGDPCPGVIVGPMHAEVRVLIEGLALLAFCLEPPEIDRQVRWLPLRY